MATNRAIGAYEAKTHLPQLLDEVAAGATITITKRGVPVAVLAPLPMAPKEDVDELLAQWRERRKHVRLNGLSIRELVEEGRP